MKPKSNDEDTEEDPTELEVKYKKIYFPVLLHSFNTIRLFTYLSI